jgi:hypothetical protein
MPLHLCRRYDLLIRSSGCIPDEAEKLMARPYQIRLKDFLADRRSGKRLGAASTRFYPIPCDSN